MSDGFDFKDIEEALRELEKIPEKMQKRAYTKALNKAAKIIAKDMKQRMRHVDTGNLAASFGTKVMRNKNGKGATAVVGATRDKRKDAEKKEMPTRYFHLVEGAAQMIEDSVQSCENRAEEAIRQSLAKDIEKEFS